MPYKVKLETFEGPLDLLLFLIKKNEVDVYDIPIAEITKQYLDYLEIIQLFDLEGASDFILMAATLMRIKAQMLLPKSIFADEEEEIEDPRQELVHRLLEYKRFKDVAIDLREKEGSAQQLYSRGSFKFEEDGFEGLMQGSDVTLFDLVAAFRELLVQSKKVSVHRVRELNVTLEERIEFVQQTIAKRAQLKFRELFHPEDDKIVWVVTFIAILELIKRHIITVAQKKPFEELLLIKLNGQ
jgi:segregation and condensation protein A